MRPTCSRFCPRRKLWTISVLVGVLSSLLGREEGECVAVYSRGPAPGTEPSPPVRSARTSQERDHYNEEAT
jgi:hypothetical protein